MTGGGECWGNEAERWQEPGEPGEGVALAGPLPVGFQQVKDFGLQKSPQSCRKIGNNFEETQQKRNSHCFYNCERVYILLSGKRQMTTRLRGDRLHLSDWQGVRQHPGL